MQMVEIVVVIVKDTSIGIDKEMFPKLYTKFTTKSFQGIGFGLYLKKYYSLPLKEK